MLEMINDIHRDKLSKLRILYVEDDSETREELSMILQSWVDVLYVAVNGSEGLNFYRKYEPDIVITDIQMPILNGLGMSSEIKRIKRDQCIVVLSAYNDVEYLFKAMELGIQHYITKPVMIDRLQAKLTQIAEFMSLESEALRSRKLLEQYKLMVDEKAIVCKMDSEGFITYVNQHFCALSGYTEHELIGREFRFLFESDEQFSEIRSALSGFRKWTGILINTSKKGGRYVVDASLTAVVAEGDQIEEYVALMVDITDMYEKHERLSLHLQNDLNTQNHLLNEYERALELGTSLCVIDPDGIIVSANPSFSNGLGCLPEDLTGLPFDELIKDYLHFKEWALPQITGQGSLSRVMNMRFKEGLEKTFSIIIVAIHDVQGSLHSLLALSQDITDSIRLNREIMDTQKELLYVMGEVVENRSQETGMHVKRVAELSKFIALKYGLTEQHSEMIKIASPMHDVGKVGISDHILHKPGKLTEEEFKVMKTHAQLGYNLLKKLDKPLIKMAANIAYHHHEHFDGSGYPNGLSGEEISIEGKIVALVDVFDALSSERAYKKPWPHDAILDYIETQRGKQFEPVLVDIMLDNMDDILALRNLYKD
ncbi:MAG: PAS domain S-box protein [Methylicorpusculum sp.]|nr:PAS domain S-box protein [Methylicorpusculum sp.]